VQAISTPRSAVAKRGRGRPPKTDDASTRDRLLDAAADTFADKGFEATTVADIATSVGVTPAAIYNHFGSKEELLYAAGRRALDELVTTMSATGRTPRRTTDLATLYLQPGMARARVLLLELHVAASRRPELAAHLAAWHREMADWIATTVKGSGEDAGARIKALFLLLLGLCHLEQLDSLVADAASLEHEVSAMVDALFGRG
jgi:AcrR family transcriptional regulator